MESLARVSPDAAAISGRRTSRTCSCLGLAWGRQLVSQTVHYNEHYITMNITLQARNLTLYYIT